MAERDNVPSPKIGEWYLDLESEEQFEVVNVDEEEGTVEVQFLNGEIAEFDRDEWSARELSLIDPPEDWNASLEPVEEGDAAYDPEQPVRRRPAPGFEPDEVLLSDEAASRDQVASGSQSDEEE